MQILKKNGTQCLILKIKYWHVASLQDIVKAVNNVIFRACKTVTNWENWTHFNEVLECTRTNR